MTAARTIDLRPGVGPPLFILPGAGGQAEELAGLARALAGGRPVVAILPFEAGSVAEMGELAARAIRARQPGGPYWLLGYSFGGLVAVEAAQRLRERGGVAFLGLIDAIYDHRYWPAGVFRLALARRAVAHTARLVRQPAGPALSEFAQRAHNLARRLAARVAPARAAQPAPDAAAWRQAMAGWRPSLWPAEATLFTPEQDADFGADTAALWRPWIAQLSVRRVAATHLSLMRAPQALAALAREIDAALAAAAAPRRPRVLLAATFRWISTARLALGLREAGCEIEAVCPRGHALWRLGVADRLHRLAPLRPRASLARAIAAARPDIVIPCDDRAAQSLHVLHAAADPATGEGMALRKLITRSLGPSVSYPLVYSRAGMITLADEEGVPAPPSARIGGPAALAAWLAAHPGPVVLKTDGSWGGREVLFADTPEAAARAYRRLSRPVGPLRSAKRLLADGDAQPIAAWLTRRPPAISVQAFAPGAPGNVAVACRDGEVLGLVAVEVVRSDGPTGPATVVRVVDHGGMARAAATLVRRLGLSGLCGFDFILDPETGAANLIELNPRATPTAHLIGASGDNLLAALAASLGRAAPPPRARPAYAGALVALFPQEMRRDPVSRFLQTAHHDVPWHAPELVQAAMAEAGARPPLRRLARRSAADETV